MAGAPGYTVDEARADAREWIKGTTLHGGSRGWRVCCAILDERIAELEAALAGHRDRLMAANESGMMWRVLADSGQSLQIRSWSQTQRGEHLAAPPPLSSVRASSSLDYLPFLMVSTVVVEGRLTLNQLLSSWNGLTIHSVCQ